MNVKQHGFTIVEVIVIITVIAILAAVTVFAFGSWRERTATAEVKDSLTQLSSAITNERNFTNIYPAAVPSNYTPGKGVAITYTANAAGTKYCAKGVSTARTSVVYYVSDTSATPTTTACSV